MKTKVLVLFILSICGLSYAQTPQSFNYQAVARDVSGAVIPNSNLGIRMSILDASDNIMYSESHAKLTNGLGLFSLKVGRGTVINGDIASIDWSSGSFFLKVDIDYAGGTDYTTIGTTQILSVPYALHAETVSQNDDADADPENEIQALSIEGNELTISGGNTVNLPSSGGMGDGDSDPNNEIQDLGSTVSDTGVILSISKGGMSTSFSVNDADADPTNEIQSLIERWEYDFLEQRWFCSGCCG